MEEAQVRFGDITSADVKLVLRGRKKENYEKNPVYLHSVVLERSEFFKLKMSERWPSGKPTEVRVTTSHDFDDYLKCIELMYDERVYFSNVEECLVILSVASELLFDDFINKCMQYLEAVPWSAEQESQIRNVLSCLGLKLLPDLAARFTRVDHITFVERIIMQMVALIEDKQPTKNRENAEKYISGIFDGNTPREIVELCGRELLQKFRSSINDCDFSTISLLFKFIEHCDEEILTAAYTSFCHNLGFMKYIQELKIYETSHTYQQSCEVVIYTIMWFMKATGDGKIIISRRCRNFFLRHWLPIMRELCYERVDKLDEFDKAVVNVVRSLPLVDKIGICVEWIELYTKYDMDISTPLTLFKDLHNTHYKSTSKQ